jgi:fermentation-respiration switch protein FrsA (DUF1100 family)
LTRGGAVRSLVAVRSCAFARAGSAALAALSLGACARVPITERSVFLPRPRSATAAEAGVAAEDFFFAADDGTRLNAWYIRHPAARATVLFFGGNAFLLADSRAFAQSITVHGVNLFMMDYRGYGRSDGTPSVASFESDALRAYQVLRDRFEPDPRRIIVHGHSLGSFAATLVASERPAGALVLQNPATDGRDTLRYLVPWYARPFVRFDVAPSLLAESNLARIRRVSLPTLIAGGSRDRITSPRMAEALYRASPARDKKLVIVPGGDHNGLWLDAGFQTAYADIVAAVGR